MATPRVTIDQLPIQAAPEDTNEIIVQDSGVTKRLTIAALRSQPPQGLLDHIADDTAAHTASAVSAASSGAGVDSPTVQGQLGQLSGRTDAASSAAAAASAEAGTATSTANGAATTVNSHIANGTAAHAATAISTTTSGTNVTGINVQAQLAQLATLVQALESRVTTLETP